MIVTFLGTGTSTGVPQIGCHCPVCSSADKRDRRLRASAFVQVDGLNILVDAGPDFRQQMLDAGAPSVDAVLLTHSHYDHVGGIDDMRPYCAQAPMSVFCRPDVDADLRARIPYCFAEHLYPGVPTFSLHKIYDLEPFEIKGLPILPLPVMHARLPILGFRIRNFAYITDCKVLPDSTIDALKGVDTLVINALRIKPHLSHISLGQALDYIYVIKPRIAYLTHISHQMGLHADIEKILPPNVRLAYDGLRIVVP